MTLEIRDVDLGSKAGLTLLDTLVSAGGETLLPTARVLTRIFSVSSSWAPGLHFLGGVISVDDALRPVGLTNGQFSLLVSLNRPRAPTISEIAEFLAVDRTTLTANLKPLERRRLLEIQIDQSDRRSRRLHLTDAGLDLLVAAVPLWRRQLRAMESIVGEREAARLRSQLRSLR